MNKKLVTLISLPIILIALIIGALLYSEVLQFPPTSMSNGENIKPWNGNTLRLGTEGAYPPFNEMVRGELEGFDIDIGNAVCEAMQVKCEWVVEEWDKMMPSLLENKYDVILASMSITDERKKDIAFTNKYYVNPLQFAQIKGSKNIISRAALKGKIIGVQTGTIQESVIKSKFKESTLKVYENQEEVNQALLNGKIQLMLGEALTLDSFFKTPDGFKLEAVGNPLLDPQYIGEGVGIGIRKQDDELRIKINTAIKEIRENRTYRKINRNYFPFDIYGKE